jgi:sugar phosphate isomerase/epimerase
MPFKYSVVCDTLGGIGYDVFDNPREILSAIKAAGYDGADLGANLERIDPPEIRSIADSLGLDLPEVLGAWAYHHGGENRDLAGTDEEARQRGIEYAKRSIDLTVRLGARYFEICASQPPIPQVPFPVTAIPTLRKNFAAACREICDYAARNDIVILFEPLNQYEAYPGVLTTVREAVQMVEEIGYSNLGVQPDVFHMNISEASPLDALRAAGSHIKVIHMNETNHSWLGSGHGDHRGVIRTLKAMNFDGYISIYMPFLSQEIMQQTRDGYARANTLGESAGVHRPDLQATLKAQLSYLKEIERAVDAQPEG